MSTIDSVKDAVGFKGLLNYSYCGLPITSNIAVPELLLSKHEERGLCFRLESPRPQTIEALWLHHWRSSAGESLLSYGEQDSHHWLRFPGLADFRMKAEAKEISCYPLPGVPQETIRHLLLDQVLPRCLAHQGRIMLHASAVWLEDGLMLFIGDSGAGKSTLAGNFHRAGQTAVSDDCLWVKESRDKVMAVPIYGGLRLWEDSLQALFAPDRITQSVAHYSVKKRVPLNKADVLKFQSGRPILAMFLLSPTDQIPPSEVILDRLSHRETFIALMKHSFHLNVMDLKRTKGHMQALGCIIPGMPAYRLSMPRDYSLLPLARQRILEAVLSP